VHLRPVMIRFAVFSLVLVGLVGVAGRHLLFSLIIHRPAVWLLVMVLYPVLSVYPQGVIYRAFLFHRYRDLLPPGRPSILVSAVVFSYVHIIFYNWIAVAMTLVGGLLFAHTYWKTRSLLVSAIEHALYGCLLYTIGLGRFFYHGAVH
jgi:membrane protease YdiL (CAAX protease family)